MGSTVYCDAELVNNDLKFVSPNDSSQVFNGGNLQSNLQSHGGQFSALTIPKKAPFAMAYEIDRTEPNAYYLISVWRKSKDGKGLVAVSAKDSDVFYKVTMDPVESKENGWEKLVMDVYIPPNFHGGMLKVYVWNNGSDSVFFDDLVISRPERKAYPNYDYNSGLNIVLDTSDFIKIMNKRKEAFENGILQTSDKDWVKALIVDEGIVNKTRIRLKGDWLDHLWGNKWSFRVKMRKNGTYQRLRTFSLQTPSSRNYLLEWLTHKLYHSYDVLTTRYWFTPVSINGQPRGLYAVEEHFVKQLPEWNNRREGPIVKFSEDAFWQIQKMNINFQKWPSFPFFESSVIKPFKPGRTIGNPVLFSQFKDAQKLMVQYKYGDIPASEIFDIKKLAMYYAMLDLTHARHGMTWHNQRFYFNPVIRKLEPIAFDGYTSHESIEFGLESNLGYETMNLENPEYPELIHKLFTDTIFVDYYLESLEEISKSESIESFLNSIQREEQYYDSLLRLEFPIYPYNKDFLRESASSIRSYLPELKRLFNEIKNTGGIIIPEKEHIYNDTSVYENTPEYMVIAYDQGSMGDKKKVKLINYFPSEILLVGSGINEKFITEYFAEIIDVEAYSSGFEGQQINIEVDTASEFVYFMIQGINETFKVPVNPWHYPKGSTSQQELYQFASVNYDFIQKVEGKDIIVKKGSFTINKPVVIPPGYQLRINEGTHIDLVDSAMVISYSPLIIKGSDKSPVKITSSDFTGNGITVLQAEGKSTLDHVIFENLNTLNYKGWILTGAVTFYESDVEIRNTTFYRNQCEDALNTIRSNFIVDRCNFEYTFGDAFDADFCTGTIVDNTYKNIGNDAMDFSGSDILIKNTVVEGANDKGISGGEDSRVTVHNVVVSMANIGFASKDLSKVKITDSKVLSCNYGFVLLQKKPEYGPSKMVLRNTEIKDAKTEYLVEIGSVVIMDNDTIKGAEKDLGLRFY